MPKYVLAYHGGRTADTETEQAEVMAQWGAWFESLGSAVVDPGNPTGESQTIAADGSARAGGGPNPLTGYSLITATSLDDAVGLAKGCPVLAADGTIEVAETIDM